MILKNSKLAAYFSLLFVCFQVQAQDSLSIYQDIENQLNQLRVFNSTYYYNPANMQDYSSYSFSNIQLRYQNLQKDQYFMQEGDSKNEVKFETNSYKAQKNNNTLWGSASYLQNKTKNIRWNNNIDLSRIAPFVIADSIGGTMNLQTYAFKGGYAKKLKKLTLAAAFDYTASLSYKTQDPRPKNITSDLNFKVGMNYPLNQTYKIGLAAGINRYTQSSTIIFSSELQRTSLYHMNGLGTYNYFFSSKSSSAFYNDFSHNYTLTLGTKNNTFSFTAGTTFGTLSKDVSISAGNSTYEINRLKRNETYTALLKIFELNNHYKLGGKLHYKNTVKKGFETLYTNNTEVLQKLLEKENYAFDTDEINFSVIFQYQNPTYTVSAVPFFSLQTFSEKKYDAEAYQNIKSQYLGTGVFYMQQLNAVNILTLQSNIYIRRVQDIEENYNTTERIGIDDWVQNDFYIKSLEYKTVESSLRYDRKLHKKRTLYTIFAFDYISFSNKNTNTQTTISLGVTF